MRKPFEPGNPIGKTGGRPKGARNKLARKFLEDCYADWQEHGVAAIKVMRMEDPAGYCKMMASLVPRELELTSTVLTELSDDERPPFSCCCGRNWSLTLTPSTALRSLPRRL
jgi:hypothetical protein